MRFFVFLTIVCHCQFITAEEDNDRLPPPREGKLWRLIWHDEFDGDKLDESKWTYRPDGKRKGGWWSRKAVSLDGDEVDSWAGDINKAKLPDRFMVDYVRVYDLVDDK